jgi:hypothetical protein
MPKNNNSFSVFPHFFRIFSAFFPHFFRIFSAFFPHFSAFFRIFRIFQFFRSFSAYLQFFRGFLSRFSEARNLEDSIPLLLLLVLTIPLALTSAEEEILLSSCSAQEQVKKQTFHTNCPNNVNFPPFSPTSNLLIFTSEY